MLKHISLHNWAPAKTLAVIIGTVAALLAVAGCGSGTESSTKKSETGASANVAAKSTSASASANASPGLQRAEAAYKQFVQFPTTIDLPAIKKPVPTGKEIAFIYCGVSECQTLAEATKKAAAVLGWKVKVIATNGTPTSVKEAWTSAVRLHPTAVIATSFPTELYASELNELKQMHIPVFNYATTDPGPNGNVTVRQGSPSQQRPQGRALAALAVTYTKAKANTLFVTVPAYSILEDNNKGFEEAYKEWCKACELHSLALPVTDVGTSAGTSLIVSYLRSHPSVNFVAFDLDAAAVGLPAALKAAGIDVPFAGQSPTVQNLSYIQQGTELGTVQFPGFEYMAILVDAAARYVVGESLAPDRNAKVSFWIETKSNLRSATGYSPIVPNLYGALAKLWGKK